MLTGKLKRESVAARSGLPKVSRIGTTAVSMQFEHAECVYVGGRGFTAEVLYRERDGRLYFDRCVGIFSEHLGGESDVETRFIGFCENPESKDAGWVMREISKEEQQLVRFMINECVMPLRAGVMSTHHGESALYINTPCWILRLYWVELPEEFLWLTKLIRTLKGLRRLNARPQDAEWK